MRSRVSVSNFQVSVLVSVSAFMTKFLVSSPDLRLLEITESESKMQSL